jgi:hypothetical protein
MAVGEVEAGGVEELDAQVEQGSERDDVVLQVPEGSGTGERMPYPGLVRRRRRRRRRRTALHMLHDTVPHMP